MSKFMVQRGSDGKVTLSPEVERFWLEGSTWMPDPSDLTPSLERARELLARAEQELALWTERCKQSREAVTKAEANERSAREHAELVRMRDITLDTLDVVQARRTPPVSVADGRMIRWYVLVGYKGKMLAVYEVTSYRRNHASQVWGGIVPVGVYVAVMRAFDLEAA